MERRLSCLPPAHADIKELLRETIEKGAYTTMYTKKSLLRLAVCLAFVITLLAGTAAPSLATMNPQGALVGTEQNPADAAITKVLAVGQETPVPSLTFVFNITKISLDGALVTANPNLNTIMPTIQDRTVQFSNFDAHPMANNMSNRENQTDYLRRESSSLFPAGTPWTQSGIYVYRVTEVQSVQGYFPDPARETLTFSRAQYDLHVYVGERTGQPGSYYVWAIGAYRILDDQGQQAPQGTKVNPKPGGPGGQTPWSMMTFQNNYLRHGSGQSADGRFQVKNTVSGLGSSSALYFQYDVTVNKPIISTKTTYRVYIFEGTTNVPLTAAQLQNNVQNQGLINMAGYIDMPLGTPVRFMLKHNQFLSFVDIDAGATYVVNGLATQFYTPSYTIYRGGFPAGAQNGQLHQALSTPTTPPTTVTISPTNAFIDRVEFTNAREPITPTGISVDNVPFVALIAVSILGLGAYLFFRVRVRKNDDAVAEPVN